jgi:hypothetical protein
MNLTEILCKGVEWIQLAQDRDHFRVLVAKVMSLWGEFLDIWASVSISRSLDSEISCSRLEYSLRSICWHVLIRRMKQTRIVLRLKQAFQYWCKWNKIRVKWLTQVMIHFTYTVQGKRCFHGELTMKGVSSSAVFYVVETGCIAKSHVLL